MGFNKVLHRSRKVITMNEQRHRAVLDMTNKTKTRADQEWQELIQRFQVLLHNATTTASVDILQEIINIINSLQSNKPKPKVYRAKAKRFEELKVLINKNTNTYSH